MIRPQKIMKQMLLEEIARHMQVAKVIQDRQHNFSKGRPCLTNLVAFYNAVTELVENGRAADVVYLDLSKVHDTTPHIISILERFRVEGRPIWWIKNWLDGHNQRVGVNDSIFR